MRYVLVLLGIFAPSSALAQPPPDAACAPFEAPAASGSASDAIAAYVATVDAWNAAITSGVADDASLAPYYAHFAATLDCWYGARRRPLAPLRANRTAHAMESGTLRIVRLDVLRESADEVVLYDVGVDEGNGHLHEKEVLMRRTAGVWRIAGETSAHAPGCFPTEPRVTSHRCHDREVRQAPPRDVSGEGNWAQIQSEAQGGDDVRCHHGVSGGPSWLSVPDDGAIARMEDVVWAHMRSPSAFGAVTLCRAFAPTTVQLVDLDGDGHSEALVVEGGVASVFEIEQGWLERRARLSTIVWDESDPQISAEDGDDVTSLSMRDGMVVMRDGRGEHRYAVRGRGLVDVDVEARTQRLASLSAQCAHAPDDVAARCAYASALRTPDDVYRSAAEYRHALASAGTPTTTAARRSLAACLSERGRSLASEGHVVGARADLERSLSLDPTEAARAALAALPASSTIARIEAWPDPAQASAHPVPAEGPVAAQVSDPTRARPAFAHVTIHADVSVSRTEEEYWLTDTLFFSHVDGAWLALGWYPGQSPRVSVVPGLDGPQIRVDGRDTDGAVTTFVRWGRFRDHGNLWQVPFQPAPDVWVGEGGTVVVGPSASGEPARVFELSTD